MGNKSSGMRTHHAMQAHMWGNDGRQSETSGNNEDASKADTPNTVKHVEKQWETIGDKVAERRPQNATHAQGDSSLAMRTRHPTKGNKREMPENGKHNKAIKDNGKQAGTRGDKTSRSGFMQHRHTSGETGGTSGTRTWEGGQTMQHKHAC